jgi:membrane protease YdiL (CAAX protease family)
MDTQHVNLSWLKKAGIAILLLLCGFLVFVFGTNYYYIFPTNDSQLYRVVLAVIFLGAALILRRNQSLQSYSWIAYAFFISILIYFLTSLTAEMRDAFFRSIHLTFGTARHAALSKIFEATLTILVIIFLTLLWGEKLSTLYIRKGRLGLSLFIGLCMLTINTTTGIVTGAALGQAGEQIIAQLPWVLLLALANGLMEELMFRGLFLRKYASLIGMPGAIIVTSIIFTVMHSAASYMNPLEAVLFQLIIFPMALLFGYIMHKTDNVWGAALFHAGSDVFLFYLVSF